MAITNTPAPLFTAADFVAALQTVRTNVAEVAREVGINRQYLSEFRAGSRNLQPELLQRLREHFEAKGLAFDESGQGDEPDSPPAPATLADLDNREDLTRALLCVRHFSLSPALDGEQIAAALARMDENDATIRALMDKPAEPGLFSEWNDVTESRLQEVFGLLAENFLLFRHLQGRALVPLANMTEGVDYREVKTIGDLMATLLSGSLHDMGAALTPKSATADKAAEPEAPAKRVGMLIEGEAA
ncbi:MAG: helix-turn-helix transcriptional regulator [Pseudomonadota bacterium]|nr:helix-turn-helix transcriptional regulator [Pseudomonadota bacterium]